MSSSFVLIDTDVISGHFGRNTSLKNHPKVKCLDELFSLELVRVSGHVFQESLNKINKGQVGTYRKIKNRLTPKIYTPTRADYIRAVEISRKCKDLTLSIADLMNCAIVLNRDWTLLTLDKDYQGVKRHEKALNLLEIV